MNKDRRKKIFAAVIGGAGGGQVEYLFRALFGVDDAAPIANPTTVEVGTIVPTDTGNKMDISGGSLNLLGKSTWGDPAWRSGAAIPRAAGNALVFRVNPVVYTPTTYYAVFGGWSGTTINSTPNHGFSAVSANLRFNILGVEIPIFPALEIREHTLAVVMRSTGCYIVSADHSRLLWVDKSNTAAHYLGGDNYHAQTFKFTETHAAAWGADWESDTALLAANVASPANDETITHEADGLIEFTWTPSAGQTLSIEFRKTDADNLWRLDCSQAGGTIKLWERVAGSETEYSTGKTQTWTAGTPYRIVLYLLGTTINSVVNNVAKNTTSAAYSQRTATTAKVSGFTTGSNLQAWKSNINSLIPSYIRQTVPVQFYSYGDSRAIETGFPPTFETLTGQRLVVGGSSSGGTAVGMAGTIVATLAALHGVYDPTYIMCNIGINDVSAGTTEANFKTAYLAILDALHAKWPDATIGLMRVWRTSGGTDNVCAWIDYVITQRAFAFAGPDERIFLENGDGGATYMADSVHPNAAGYAETAAQWKVTLGL